MGASLFYTKLRGLNHYPRIIENWESLKLELLIELERMLVSETSTHSDWQHEADNALSHISIIIHRNKMEIKSLISSGLTWNNSIPKIVQLYEDSLRLAQKYHLEPDMVLSYANFLKEQRDYPRAIELCEWLEHLYSLNEPQSLDWWRVKNLLAMCCFWNNDLQRAQTIMKEAEVIVRELAAINSNVYEQYLGITCFNYAVVLKDLHRLSESELYHREAYEIRLRLAEQDSCAFSPYLADSCDALGLVLQDQDRFTEAEKFHRKSIEIWEQISSQNTHRYESSLARAFHNLGISLRFQNRYEESESYHRKAIQIWRRLAEKNPLTYEIYLSRAYDNLGLVLVRLSRLDEAEMFHKKSLNILKRLSRRNPEAYEPNIADTHLNLGVLAMKRGSSLEAIAYFKTALFFYERHIHLYHCRKWAAITLSKIKNLEKS